MGFGLPGARPSGVQQKSRSNAHQMCVPAEGNAAGLSVLTFNLIRDLDARNFDVCADLSHPL